MGIVFLGSFGAGFRAGRAHRLLVHELRLRRVSFFEAQNPSSPFYTRAQWLQASEPQARGAIYSIGYTLGQLIRPLVWFRNAQALYGPGEEPEIHGAANRRPRSEEPPG